MHDMLAEPLATAAAQAAEGRLVRLSMARPGDAGVIVQVRAESHAGDHGVDVAELERRLLEMGFVEGAAIEILHEGLFGRDPIAVRIDDMRVALRRREAAAVTVQFHEA